MKKAYVRPYIIVQEVEIANYILKQSPTIATGNSDENKPCETWVPNMDGVLDRNKDGIFGHGTFNGFTVTGDELWGDTDKL